MCDGQTASQEGIFRQQRPHYAQHHAVYKNATAVNRQLTVYAKSKPKPSHTLTDAMCNQMQFVISNHSERQSH